MATSVKMTEHDKRRLDRLQSELTLRRGKKLSQQQLLSWLLNLGELEKEKALSEASRPMTAKELGTLRRLCVRTGVRTREEEIDRIVSEA